MEKNQNIWGKDDVVGRASVSRRMRVDIYTSSKLTLQEELSARAGRQSAISQILINIGVTSGFMPTKGLTLPLMSYGGSSLLASCLLIALVLRMDYDLQFKFINSVKRRA